MYQLLKDYIQTKGLQELANPQRLCSLLDDSMPQDTVEKRILKAGLRYRFLQQMAEENDSQNRQLVMQKFIQKAIDELGLSNKWAFFLIEQFALILEWIDTKQSGGLTETRIRGISPALKAVPAKKESTLTAKNAQTVQKVPGTPDMQSMVRQEVERQITVLSQSIALTVTQKVQNDLTQMVKKEVKQQIQTHPVPSAPAPQNAGHSAAVTLKALEPQIQKMLAKELPGIEQKILNNLTNTLNSSQQQVQQQIQQLQKQLQQIPASAPGTSRQVPGKQSAPPSGTFTYSNPLELFKEWDVRKRNIPEQFVLGKELFHHVLGKYSNFSYQELQQAWRDMMYKTGFSKDDFIRCIMRDEQFGYYLNDGDQQKIKSFLEKLL